MPDPTQPPAATPPAGASGTPPATPPAATPPATPPAGTETLPTGTPPAAGKPAEPPATPPATPAKPAEGTPAAPVVPEKYDLKLPEGSLIDPSALEEFSAQAKADKLTQEQAQTRLERDSALFASFEKSQQAKLESESTKWIESVKTDKEIGGDELNRNVEVAKQVVQKFGTPQLMEDLNRTRLGNYPEFVRMMVRIGKAMSPDQLIVPGSSTPKTEKPIEDIFYGETTPSQQPTT